MLTKTSATQISSTDIAFLLVGPAGSGKSKFAADMAELGKTLILYCDKKAGKSTYAPNRCSNSHNIDLWEFEDIDDNSMEATKEFGQSVNELLSIPKEEFPYKFVWLDSLTSYNDLVLRWAVSSNAMKGKGGNRLGDASLNAQCPTQTDYGVQLNHIKYTINRLLLLSCTVGVIAHERDVYNKEGYMIEKVIDVTGKETYARNIANRFSEIYRSYQKVDQITNECKLEMITTGNEVYSWCSSKGLGVPQIINGFEDVKRFMTK